ncbi:MAG: tyrosine-type recombinase/integrase [Oscillospiraceae bacterium]
MRLDAVSAKHIQDYYNYELEVNHVTANTVKHRHANIHKAFAYAYKTDLIQSNPADKVELPKIEKYSGQFYNQKQIENLIRVVKGDPIEFGVITASFYGLRRSEVLGLKWDAIDFENKTITIRHTVHEVTIDGKTRIVASDTTKTKSSYRSLPLVKPFEEILLKMKREQEENKRLCGRCYCQDYLDYIYVNQIGEIVKPGFVTAHFSAVLKANNLPHIRFHDLRHPYVKPTTKNL